MEKVRRKRKLTVFQLQKGLIRINLIQAAVLTCQGPLSVLPEIKWRKNPLILLQMVILCDFLRSSKPVWNTNVYYMEHSPLLHRLPPTQTLFLFIT